MDVQFLLFQSRVLPNLVDCKVNKLQTKTMNALIVIDVHAKDSVSHLLRVKHFKDGRSRLLKTPASSCVIIFQNAGSFSSRQLPWTCFGSGLYASCPARMSFGDSWSSRYGTRHGFGVDQRSLKMKTFLICDCENWIFRTKSRKSKFHPSMRLWDTCWCPARPPSNGSHSSGTTGNLMTVSKRTCGPGPQLESTWQVGWDASRNM